MTVLDILFTSIGKETALEALLLESSAIALANSSVIRSLIYTDLEYKSQIFVDQNRIERYE